MFDALGSLTGVSMFGMGLERLGKGEEGTGSDMSIYGLACLIWGVCEAGEMSGYVVVSLLYVSCHCFVIFCGRRRRPQSSHEE